MFTFPGNFIWSTFNPYSSIFFSCHKKKTQALSDRLKELSLWLISNILCKGRPRAECAGKGHGDECAQRGQEDAQVSTAPGALTRLLLAHLQLGTGRGQCRRAGVTPVGTHRRDGASDCSLHSSSPWPASSRGT